MLALPGSSLLIARHGRVQTGERGEEKGRVSHGEGDNTPVLPRQDTWKAPSRVTVMALSSPFVSPLAPRILWKRISALMFSPGSSGVATRVLPMHWPLVGAREVAEEPARG